MSREGSRRGSEGRLQKGRPRCSEGRARSARDHRGGRRGRRSLRVAHGTPPSTSPDDAFATPSGSYQPRRPAPSLSSVPGVSQRPSWAGARRPGPPAEPSAFLCALRGRAVPRNAVQFPLSAPASLNPRSSAGPGSADRRPCFARSGRCGGTSPLPVAGHRAPSGTPPARPRLPASS
jgi:hypothetical protein